MHLYEGKRRPPEEWVAVRYHWEGGGVLYRRKGKGGKEGEEEWSWGNAVDVVFIMMAAEALPGWRHGFHTWARSEQRRPEMLNICQRCMWGEEGRCVTTEKTGDSCNKEQEQGEKQERLRVPFSMSVWTLLTRRMTAWVICLNTTECFFTVVVLLAFHLFGPCALLAP